MKMQVLALVSVLGLAGSTLQARPLLGQTTPRARTVQLLTMGPGSAASEPVVPDVTQLSGENTLPPPDGFRVHDLSRRWVDHQMGDGLAPTAMPPLLDIRPRANSARPERSTSELGDVGHRSSPALFAPAWMISTLPATSARLAPECGPVPYKPTGFLRLNAEARRLAYYGMMSAIACQYGLPVGLFDALIIRESRYNPIIASPKNAFGLTQLMPATAAGLGVDRFDVAQNLRGGAAYLRQQLDHFGQYHLALAAYNAGPNRVAGTVPSFPETQPTLMTFCAIGRD